jgi:hypothetical protein
MYYPKSFLEGGMTVIKLKWWMLDANGTLYAVPQNDADISGEGVPHMRGIILADDGAVRAFSYKVYWQLFVDYLPMTVFKGTKGNAKIVLEHHYGGDKLGKMLDFIKETQSLNDGINRVDKIYKFERIGFGQTTSGSRGRIVETREGGDLTLS